MPLGSARVCTSGHEAEAPRGSLATCRSTGVRARKQEDAPGAHLRDQRNPSCAFVQGAGANRGNGRPGHV
jgi:hypothetical protein